MTGSKSEVVKRYLFLVIGLLIMAFGVAFSIKAGLGTSPISSVPYAISEFTPLTVGTITIIMHCVFIAIQIIILRKNYELIQLMQLPVAIIFGYMTDFAIACLKNITCGSYVQSWIFCIIGILLVAVGVSFEVTAKAVTLAGEGVVLAICKAWPKLKFGTVKVCFDVTLVVTAVVLSLIFLHTIVGVREGTLAAAILVGTISRNINKLLKPVEKFLAKR